VLPLLPFPMSASRHFPAIVYDNIRSRTLTEAFPLPEPQKKQERKDDTRRKILLGSYLIKKMQNEANKEKILAELNEYLTEDRDRKLFDL
jgi:hypothetical protein